MQTEIFATFGPSCAETSTLKEMIQAGMTGMRLNLSHTMLTKSRAYIEAYQTAARETGVNPQLLIDMQGPELRVGKLSEHIKLKKGDMVCLCSDALSVMQENEVAAWKMPCIPIPEAVRKAVTLQDEILMDDGKIRLQVKGEQLCGEKILVKAEVLQGGILKSSKSIKIIGKSVTMPPFTVQDIENIKLANAYGVTAIMQPFVCSGNDLDYVREVLQTYHAEHIKVYAKIENRQGVEQIEDILPKTDVVVIARGDLGNDMPLWELPRVQKQLEEACKKAGKPYIVVTQMLASMEQNPVPTRAEVSDIFHAVYHGAWGVMLTGETAVGKYPVETVRYLANTAEAAEKYLRNSL